MPPTLTKNNRKKFGIVVSRFNETITQRLLDGCLDELTKLKVDKNDIQVVWVPGALEIPVVALKFARQKAVSAVICLGAVIRGETYHFEIVAEGAAQGAMQVALSTAKPVIFGVLTTDTDEQALKRSDDQFDHKGREAARTAVEMVWQMEQVK